MKAGNDYTIHSVKQALDILTLFTEDTSEMTLSQISQCVGTGKSTTLRYLYTLQRCDFLAYDAESKRYSLGLQVYRLGQIKLNATDIVKIARKHLQPLADQENKICYVGIRSGDQLIMMDKILPRFVPTWAQLIMKSGDDGELYSTGIGRLLLSQDTDEEVRAYLERTKLERFTDQTIVNKEQLFQLISQTREDGYAGNKAENDPYIASVCAPIRDYSKRIIAGISICGMQEAMEENRETYRQIICTAAASISREMGYQP